MPREDYAERRQEKIERLDAAADKAAAESALAGDEAHRMAHSIPFGQPILVGHHSEKRDRGFRARMGRKMEKAHELGKKAGELRSRARGAEENGAISSDDPEAPARLRAKLGALQARHAHMKAINRAHRAYLKNPASLERSKLTEDQRKKVRDYEPAYSWEPHPFPPWALSNNNANIKRVRGRIAELAAGPNCPDDYERAGVKVEFNEAENRAQLHFRGKPPEAERTILKRCGFRWSPRAMAWQRLLNSGAKHAIDWALDQIEAERAKGDEG